MDEEERESILNEVVDHIEAVEKQGKKIISTDKDARDDQQSGGASKVYKAYEALKNGRDVTGFEDRTLLLALIKFDDKGIIKKYLNEFNLIRLLDEEILSEALDKNIHAACVFADQFRTISSPAVCRKIIVTIIEQVKAQNSINGLDTVSLKFENGNDDIESLTDITYLFCDSSVVISGRYSINSFIIA